MSWVLSIPWSCADGVDTPIELAIVVEYSAAFWILTRGRYRGVPHEFTVELDKQEFDVVVVDVANDVGVESNNNCCTCKISTYSSRPDGLVVEFNRESVIWWRFFVIKLPFWRYKILSLYIYVHSNKNLKTLEKKNQLTILVAVATAAIISDCVIRSTDCIIIYGVAVRTAKDLIIFTTHR